MSPAFRRACHIGFVAALAACAGPRATPSIAVAPSRVPRELGDDDQAIQALNRLAFGPRPGEVAEVRAMGVDRWIERQLHPESIPDSVADALLAAMPAFREDARSLAQAYPPSYMVLGAIKRERGMADTAMFVPLPPDTAAYQALDRRAAAIAAEAVAARLARAQVSERQLLEVMTDFWENHFSVFQGKMPSRFAMLEYDRDVIRPHALGKFRDLLGAVAHSAAMLYYLDNWQNQADSAHLTLTEWSPYWTASRRPSNRRRVGVNENYARELLELHTLGVDGGYTQQDVINVARILTGWSVYSPQLGGGFAFRPEQHDAEPKVVLGVAFRGGRGQEEGEELLDLLARQPATAHYIALKLARRFVSDSPPPSVVDRAAAAFSRSDGDIRETVRAIVTSPEFFSRANFLAKVKSPLEFVISVRRAFAAAPDTTQRTAQLVSRLGEPLWGHLAPNGWPEAGSEWMNSGALMQRIALGADVSANRVPGVRIENTALWKRLAGVPRERQVDAVIAELLPGDRRDDMRAAMREGASPLRDLIALAVGSPAFQRR